MTRMTVNGEGVEYKLDPDTLKAEPELGGPRVPVLPVNRWSLAIPVASGSGGFRLLTRSR